MTSLWSSPSFPTSHNFQSSHQFSYSQSPSSHSLSKHHFPFLKSLSLSYHHFPFLRITFPFSSSLSLSKNHFPFLIPCPPLLLSVSPLISHRVQEEPRALAYSLSFLALTLTGGNINKYADVECKISEKRQESLMLQFTFKGDSCDSIT